jgi:putative DNA methylase
VMGAGFAVVNSQPVKAEMSVATPKSQAKEPIQLDIIVVCRKAEVLDRPRPTAAQALESARAKLGRLCAAGFNLSRNDRKIVILGQHLATLGSPEELDLIAHHAEGPVEAVGSPQPANVPQGQLHLFD